MRSVDGYAIKNVAASSAQFKLQGGYYQLAAGATWGGGSVKLQQVLPDGSTLVDTAAALTANGLAYAYVPPGTYQITVATATAVYAAVTRVPGE